MWTVDSCTRSRARLLGVGCLALLMLCCARTDRSFQEAIHLLDAEEYERAVVILDQLSPESADDYRLHRSLAVAHAGLGDLAESVHHTRMALELDHRRASVEIIEMAAPFFEGRRISEGRAYYEALQPVLQLASGEPALDLWRVPFHLATLARRWGEPEMAKRGFAQAEMLRLRSVVVVVIDTLRADHLGSYRYARPTSPNLDRWATEGRLFERAYSTSSWTLPSFGSLYTGYLPMRHRAGIEAGFHRRGSIPANKLSSSVRTVAEMFAAKGMRTGAVMNNPYLGPPFGVSRGFEVYDYEPGGLHETRRADVMVDRSLALVDRWGDDPFFLVIHLFDPHMDYDPPADFRGKFSDAYDSRFDLPIDDLGLRRPGTDLTDADREFIRAAYDEEIAFVDQQLGRLRQGLADRGTLGHALVVITADHGEELFEHGGFEHGHAMWQEILHVPLIVWAPGVLAGRESRPVSLVDVAPTLLEWAGVPVPKDFHGESLLPNLLTGENIPVRTLVAEGRLYGPSQSAIIQWPLKIVVGQGNRAIRVVDLSVDPEETQNLLESDSERVGRRVRKLVRQLRALRRTARMGQQDERVELSEETLERLRSLGYVR